MVPWPQTLQKWAVHSRCSMGFELHVKAVILLLCTIKPTSLCELHIRLVQPSGAQQALIVQVTFDSQALIAETHVKQSMRQAACKGLELRCNCQPASILVQDVTIPPSSSIAFAYHGNNHHLFVGSKACTYTTEICPNKNASDVTAANPCNYAFPATGLLTVN